MVVRLLTLLLAATLGIAPAYANTAQPRLLDLWFKFMAQAPLIAPYSWIRPLATASQQSAARTQLLTKLTHLKKSHPQLAQAITQWQQQLAANSSWREPGHWGPASLMTHNRSGVPPATLAAIGSCQFPDWVEVWSQAGVLRLPWQPTTSLHQLLNSLPDRPAQQADWARLVLPWGEVEHRGIAAWNLDDTQLLPGTRLVIALPIGASAASQLSAAVADYLAHLLPGDDCQQLTLKDSHAPH